jgi:hypothetical protein
MSIVRTSLLWVDSKGDNTHTQLFSMEMPKSTNKVLWYPWQVAFGSLHVKSTQGKIFMTTYDSNRILQVCCVSLGSDNIKFILPVSINCRDAAFQSFKYSLNFPLFWFTSVCNKLDIQCQLKLLCGAFIWYATHNILGHINIFTLVYEKLIPRLMQVFPTTLSDCFSTSLENMLGHESG